MNLIDRIARLEKLLTINVDTLPAELHDNITHFGLPGQHSIIRRIDGLTWEQLVDEPFERFKDRVLNEARCNLNARIKTESIHLTILRPRLTLAQWMSHFGLNQAKLGTGRTL